MPRYVLGYVEKIFSRSRTRCVIHLHSGDWRSLRIEMRSTSRQDIKTRVRSVSGVVSLVTEASTPPNDTSRECLENVKERDSTVGGTAGDWSCHTEGSWMIGGLEL